MTENEALKIMKISPEMKKEIPNLAEVYEVAVKALEENQQYRAIGTVEEFKALKEKSVPKKVVDNTPTENKEEFWYQCPNCKCDLTKIRGVHCWGCGQKLDWQ